MTPPRRRTAAVLYAWSAGIAFALSLGYSCFFYFVVLGRPTPRHSPRETATAVVINILLFGVFAVHHSVMARSSAKGWLQRWIPRELERATYVWIASVLFFTVCRAWADVPGSIYTLSGGWAWSGFVVQTAGVWIIVRASSTLDVLELAGVRQITESGQSPAASGSAELTVGGPYRFVRHPLYLGWILVVFGAPTMTSNRLAFAAISTTYLLAAIPWEERSLLHTFGEQYRTYAARVRWRLVPGVY